MTREEIAFFKGLAIGIIGVVVGICLGKLLF